MVQITLKIRQHSQSARLNAATSPLPQYLSILFCGLLKSFLISSLPASLSRERFCTNWKSLSFSGKYQDSTENRKRQILIHLQTKSW